MKSTELRSTEFCALIEQAKALRVENTRLKNALATAEARVRVAEQSNAISVRLLAHGKPGPTATGDGPVRRVNRQD